MASWDRRKYAFSTTSPVDGFGYRAGSARTTGGPFRLSCDPVTYRAGSARTTGGPFRLSCDPVTVSIFAGLFSDATSVASSGCR
ncbi:unnamed protein product [Phytophthora fragariaefolia]|uniref:Unnamed protein product n=1 Tax=Phytophthora fragariaefolia TaxID=1490495 RepID=A0A9W7CRD7_9STRA|nr:unnamed protein product [Phytophthora fragariaefolia]